VAAALVALAVLVLPPLLARRRRTAPARPSAQVSTATSLVDLIAETMGGLVGWAVGHRRAATGLAAACLGSIVLPFSGLGQEAFTQEQNSDSVRYGVDFDTDYTLAEAADEIRLHEDFLDRQQEAIGFDHWSSRFDEQGGSLTIYWDEPILPSERKAHQRTLRREAPRPAGHRLRFSDSEQEGEFSANLAVFQLRGPDSEVLAQLGIQAERLLRGVEGLSSVRGPLSNAPNQLEIDFDRDLALSMGVNSETAQNTIAWNLRGWPLPQYQEEGREVPFLIEYDQEEVAGLSTLRDMQVFTGQGQVPLASFAALSFRPASRQIERLDGQITFALTAEVDDPTRATELTEKGYEALAALDLPRGYSLGLDSSARARQQEEFAEMGRAFLLSVVLVFLLMGILFESVARPFSVLVTIPFAVLGAIWTLWLVGTPMDVMAWIGLIILAGVVVNNGIVLIDRIHRLRGELDAEAGPEPDPDGERARRRRDLAVVQGTIQRVRPVLMTAMTTIIGLLPMILAEPATDAIDYRGLGTIVAGGLAASTFFTLWVVPLAYTAIDDLTRAAAAVAHFARFGRRGAPPREPRAAT
jgi:HAE1 family hydrophobic/amphiphilic exporter-1